MRMFVVLLITQVNNICIPATGKCIRMWKQKKRLFEQYETAKETLIQLLASGIHMEEIIRHYYGNDLLKKAV